MTELKIPTKRVELHIVDFIPFVGLFARKFRIAKECSSLEKMIRKDFGLPQVPVNMENAENTPHYLRDWRERQTRTNEDFGEFKFDLYHLATTATPLLYALVSSYQ